ncbi:MAG: hypothetical protein H3Z49_08235 [archaeon]|nr:hypothetical protein [archaeon]
MSLFFLVLSSLVFIPVVLAHTPLQPPIDNESLETALLISDPTKSWALYAELHEGGEAEYYRLDMGDGERLYTQLFIPTSEKNDFLPNLAIMGPGIASHDVIPEYVEVPEGAGVMLVEAQRPDEPSYEPFTPSSSYFLAQVDLEVSSTGTYFIAVFEPSQGGRYGLAIGYREEFGLDEWIRVPIDVIGIHQWEGQSLAFILAPMIATVIIGFGLFIWKRKGMFRNVFYLTGVSAGLLYIGSGAMMFTQMILALTTANPDLSVFVTIVFALIPILLGIAIIRLTTKDRDGISKRVRVLLALLGFLGLFAWAGLIVGPALSLLTSVLPAKRV